MTDYLQPGKTTTGITQNQHWSYSISSSRNSDESCHLGVWLFHDIAPAHKSLVARQALCNCEFVQLNHPAYSLDLAPSRAGFTTSRAPVQKKMWMPLIYNPHWTQWQPMTPARHTKSFHLSPNHYFNISGLLQCCKKWRKKFVLSWGPLFVGAPVRPNMLNMPKSASASQ